MKTEVPFYNTASEGDKEIFRKWLISHLNMGTVSLTFSKKDGTIREMKATLKSDVVPEVENKRTFSSNVITVWDLEKSAWRSVRYESMKTVTFTLE